MTDYRVTGCFAPESVHPGHFAAKTFTHGCFSTT